MLADTTTRSASSPRPAWTDRSSFTGPCVSPFQDIFLGDSDLLAQCKEDILVANILYPNWPASCKEDSLKQQLCRTLSGSFRFVCLFQSGMVWHNNPFSLNDPDHPDEFACPDDMRFVQNFRAGRDSRDKFPLWSCCKEEGAVQQFSGFTFDSLRRG